MKIVPLSQLSQLTDNQLRLVSLRAIGPTEQTAAGNAMIYETAEKSSAH